MEVDSRSIHAFIIGEHGDSELAAWSEARVGGMPINDFCELRGHYDHESSMEKIFNSVKTVPMRSLRESTQPIMELLWLYAGSAQQLSVMSSPFCRYPA